MNGTGFREGLLAAEGASPELEGRYRERLRTLTEQRLTPVARASHAVGLLIALALVVRFVQLFVTTAADQRPVKIAALVVGLAFSVGWVLASAAVLRSGVDRLFTNAAVRMQLVVAFTFLLAGLMVWAGVDERDAAQGARLMLFGLTFWCAIGLPFLIAHLVRGAEVRARADLLRLELTLAERAAREVRS